MSTKFATQTVDFTIDECNLLIETLLFSSSVNICADWKEKDLRNMIKIADKIKNNISNKINLKNISFMEEENYEDDWTKDMHNIFANFYNVVELKNV